MVNPLSNVEMQALEAIVTTHNFHGILAGLSAMCSKWKTAPAVDSYGHVVFGEAERDVLVVMEEFLELSAKEAKLVVMAQRNVEQMREAFKHHADYKALLGASLDPPDVGPEAK